jgi:hypothetical protein
MKITTKLVIDMRSGETLEHEWFEYTGPIALCDRAAQSEDKAAASTAAGTAAGLQGQANAASAALTPFYRQEMNAQHLYSPQQNQELLNAAGAPLAASAATTAGQARSEAARTRNTSGFSAGLDQAARDRNAAMGMANQGIAAQDIMGAKQLNQQGAAGLSGLYGTDTGAMLKAMGLRNDADQNAVEAGKSGWLQNMNATIQAVTGALKPPGKP